jgi:outer membrane protein
VPENTTYNHRIGSLLPIFRVQAVGRSLVRTIGKKTEGVHYSMSGKSKLYICALSLGLSIALSAAAFGQSATAPQPSGGNAPAASAPAEPAGPAGPAKIGIINIQDAILACNEGKKEFEALDARFAPKRNELKAQNDEVTGLQKDLQAKGDKLNDEERAKEVKNLETKQKTLQRNYEDAQNEFQQAQQEVVNRIGQKMLTVLEKYGNENGYTIILDVSNPQTPVLWAKEGTLITKQVVDAYNAAAPVAPGAPAPKPSGAAANRVPSTNSATTPKKP